MKNRKTYCKECKLYAIALARGKKYAVVAARNLDVRAQVLGRWINEAEIDGHAFRGNGRLTLEQDEICKLKAQAKRLEIEREILKKRWSSL
jgi:transposase